MPIFSNALIAYMLFLVSLLGLSMGSFLHCLSYRLCNNESILKGRSHCSKCNHKLSTLELIPVFSFLFQKGKCKNCKTTIPIRYPVSEIITMIVFLSIVLKYTYSLDTIKFILLACVLLVAVFSDMETMIIPDTIHILALINWLVFALLSDNPMLSIKNGFIGGVSFLVGMYLIVTIADKIIKKDTMGGADIKLFVVTGFYFGILGNILLLMISCFVGIIFACIIGRARKEFPFSPAISIATWITIIFGEQILEWYIGFFK